MSNQAFQRAVNEMEKSRGASCEQIVRSIEHLLVTPLHERALKACEDASIYADKGYMVHPTFNVCACIGRESLAAKKPKAHEFAVFHSSATGEWCVVGPLGMPDGCVFRTLNEQQARSVAGALNKLEA